MVYPMAWEQLLLAVVAAAPLVVPVNSNINIVVTACLTVYIGAHRSVKLTAPTETMSQHDAMRFPFIGSAVLFSLFLLFKFVPKELVNAVLTAYFVFLGILALTATLSPLLAPAMPASLRNRVLGPWRLQLPYVSKGMTCSTLCVQTNMAHCVQGIEFLSLGSFKIGCILLCGLFVYDVFWVFCTPVMVSVAKSFDAPIKLLFPTVSADATRPFSMLGLGDIVIPGIFVALVLRYDIASKGRRHYFYSAFAGYAAGLGTTIAVMNIFQAAQPALLYIVPGVIGFVTVHCLKNGELKQLLEFDESSGDDDKSKARSDSEAESKKTE
eukprot:jgi/Chlat1/8244/Chrsp77S07672